jgi:hypothetical protein
VNQSSVIVAKDSDKRTVIEAIVGAFAADPMARWCWPDDEVYASIMPEFAQAFGGRAFGSAARPSRKAVKAWCSQAPARRSSSVKIRSAGRPRISFSA